LIHCRQSSVEQRSSNDEDSEGLLLSNGIGSSSVLNTSTQNSPAIQRAIPISYDVTHRSLPAVSLLPDSVRPAISGLERIKLSDGEENRADLGNVTASLSNSSMNRTETASAIFRDKTVIKNQFEEAEAQTPPTVGWNAKFSSRTSKVLPTKKRCSFDGGEGTFSASGGRVLERAQMLRRHSVARTDSLSYLQVPPTLVPIALKAACQKEFDSISQHSVVECSGSGASVQSSWSLLSRTKLAPKVIYSHSEDRITTSPEVRPIIPSLPYSPYGSPGSSPRLHRQPTKETRRLSITENEGWTQLNQYRLKDEIGKVLTYFYLSLVINIYHCTYK